MKRFKQPVEPKEEVVVQLTQDDLVDVAKEACAETINKFDVDFDNDDEAAFASRLTAVLADFTAIICHELFSETKLNEEEK